MLIHREALELARFAPAEDEGGTLALTCLLIESDGHVVVCDGHQLIRVAGQVDEPSLFDSLIPAEEREHSEAILLPAEAAQSFNAALKKRKKKKGEPTPHIVVSRDGEAVRLASADGKVTRRFDVKPPDLPFPKIESLLRPHVAVKRVTLGVDLMLTILKALKGCGCESATFSFAEGEAAPVKFTAFSQPMGPVEGVVMPMRDGAEKDAANESGRRVTADQEHRKT
jgi:hypothetical protein